MILLCAYYKGTLDPGQRDRFDTYVAGVHLPLVAAWPRLRGLRLQRNDGHPYLEEMPQYYQCFELAYDSQEDLAASLASDAREATRQRSLADAAIFKQPFRGEILHMVYETTDIAVPRPAQGAPRFLRCAYYMGEVKPKDREGFDRYCLEVHLPDVATWPHLRGLRLLKNQGEDFLGEPPRYYHCFELAFGSQQDMDACMASEARKETRRIAGNDFGRFKGLFQGEVHHVNYAVTEVPLTPRRDR